MFSPFPFYCLLLMPPRHGVWEVSTDKNAAPGSSLLGMRYALCALIHCSRSAAIHQAILAFWNCVHCSIKKWGNQFSGFCPPSYIDGMVFTEMLLRVTGEPVFIPLLKEIYILMLRKLSVFDLFTLTIKRKMWQILSVGDFGFEVFLMIRGDWLRLVLQMRNFHLSLSTQPPRDGK